MRRVLFAALLALGCASSRDALVIEHVNVVDVANGRVLTDQTVRLPGRGRIDGRGLYLIPGLWDMHAHLWDHDVTPALFLANGVTGVRDMGSDLAATVALRDAIRRGERVGPQIVTSGEIVDGPRDEEAPHRIIAATPEEGRAAVTKLLAGGADFIKVYHFLARETYLAVADECRKRGVAFAGHLPPSVTAQEAVQAGQKSIEHLYGIREAVLKGEVVTFPDAWQTPTLAHYRSVAFRDTPDDPFYPDPYERYLTPEMRAFQERYQPRRQRTEAQAKQLAESYEKFQAVVLRMQKEGVPLLAGSDNGIRHVHPGFGLHDELAQLVAAGLTPAEALRTATVNPLRYLDLEVEDYVLLRGNPLEDLAQTRAIEGVIAGGKYFDRAALDRLLAQK